MKLKRTCGCIATVILVSGIGLSGQALDPKLAFLEPLVNRDWRGMMTAPDGSAEWETTCRFETAWAGKVIRYSRATPVRASYEEGFIYWDDTVRKPAFFFIHSGGVFRTGFVSAADGVVTFEGRMTWPSPPADPGIKQRYDFRNTFEFTSSSEMTDRWFQNAFGPWRPGHVVTFKAEERTSGSR